MEICLLRSKEEGGNISKKDFIKKLKSYSSIVITDLNTCKLNRTITKLSQ